VKVNRQLEILDALRGATAFYVLIHHFVHLTPAMAAWAPYFVFGQFAVMIFFVLSGFVIGYSVGIKGGTLKTRSYLVGRFRRIYPVLIVVMLASWWMMQLTMKEDIGFKWPDFVGNLLQLQDAPHPGRAFEPYMFNFVLWSLAYECWFYLLFYLLYRGLPGKALQQDVWAASISVAGMLSYLAYPNALSMYASYFVLWWAGLRMAREYVEAQRVSLPRQWDAWALIAAMGAGWWLVGHFQIGRAADFVGTDLAGPEYPLLQMRHFLSVLIVVVIAFAWYRLGFPLYRYLLRPFRHFGPISYALYISHLVVIRTLQDAWAIPNPYLGFLVAIPLSLGVAWLLEQPFQRWVNRWLR
jgi:peptidoglycan/LPS O-acetylase OafA/YrhL